MPHTLQALELTLWTPATRHNRVLMVQTFAPDFHEFGRSGRRYTRAELLDTTQARPFDATLHDFKVLLLSPTIAHCTYISELRLPTQTEWANRSSTWDSTSGQWQLRFHQGTPCRPRETTAALGDPTPTG